MSIVRVCAQRRDGTYVDHAITVNCKDKIVSDVVEK